MRVFTLRSVKNAATQNDRIVGVLITPEGVSPERAAQAWSYALRHTAKGLDIPDYEAAAGMLQERHPTWQTVLSELGTVSYSPALAETDPQD